MCICQVGRAPSSGSKRKRDGACPLCLAVYAGKFSIYDPTAPSAFPAELTYLPSASSHTIIPYQDEEWPEHRLVSLPAADKRVGCLPSIPTHTSIPYQDQDWREFHTVSLAASGESVLWVCGRIIPALEFVSPPQFNMRLAARIRKRERLIREAKAAHRVRCQRRDFIQSAEYQAVLAKEKVTNDGRREEFFRMLIAPIKSGVVRDLTKIKQRYSVYKARIGAIDEHERLRRDVETYDSLAAKWEFVDAKAVTAWRETDESQSVRRIKLRFRACVEGPDGMHSPPTWLLNEVVTISNVREPREVFHVVLTAAMKVYRDWVLASKPATERPGWFGVWDAVKRKMRRPSPDIWAASKGDKTMVEVRGWRGWEELLGTIFAVKEEGMSGANIDAGMVDEDMDGMVHIYVRPPARVSAYI